MFLSKKKSDNHKLISDCWLSNTVKRMHTTQWKQIKIQLHTECLAKCAKVNIRCQSLHILKEAYYLQSTSIQHFLTGWSSKLLVYWYMSRREITMCLKVSQSQSEMPWWNCGIIAIRWRCDVNIKVNVQTLMRVYDIKHKCNKILTFQVTFIHSTLQFPKVLTKCSCFHQSEKWVSGYHDVTMSTNQDVILWTQRIESMLSPTAHPSISLEERSASVESV